jgi:hypothetical protein
MTVEQEILVEQALDKIAEIDACGSLLDRLLALTDIENWVRKRREAVADQIAAKRERGESIS